MQPQARKHLYDKIWPPNKSMVNNITDSCMNDNNLKSLLTTGYEKSTGVRRTIGNVSTEECNNLNSDLSADYKLSMIGSQSQFEGVSEDDLSNYFTKSDLSAPSRTSDALRRSSATSTAIGQL
jgi:hypothetical protein